MNTVGFLLSDIQISTNIILGDKDFRWSLKFRNNLAILLKVHST